MIFALRGVDKVSDKTVTNWLEVCPSVVGGVGVKQAGAHFDPVLPTGWVPFDLYYVTF